MREVESQIFDNTGVKYVTIFGASSETKPTTGIITGSVFVEVDTGKAYLYNESSSTWIEQ
jgi:hypothetical protein